MYPLFSVIDLVVKRYTTCALIFMPNIYDHNFKEVVFSLSNIDMAETV